MWLSKVHAGTKLKEGQRFDLVMDDIDHRIAKRVVQRFELRAQCPFREWGRWPVCASRRARPL